MAHVQFEMLGVLAYHSVGPAAYCGDFRDDLSIGLLVSSESLRIPAHWNVGAGIAGERGRGEAAPGATGGAGGRIAIRKNHYIMTE